MLCALDKMDLKIDCFGKSLKCIIDKREENMKIERCY
jgi:hypothetical protein